MCASPTRQSFLRLFVVLALAAAPLGATGSGCAPQPFDRTEPFSRDRVGAVRRSVQLTVSTMESAVEATMLALDRSQELCESPGESLDAAYATARGDFSSARGRQRSFARRILVTRTGGEAMFDEWRSELRTYSDAAVEQSSRESLERLEVSHSALIAALEIVRDELLPLQDSINDRVLYLKHSRNEGALAALPAMTPAITETRNNVRGGVESVLSAAAHFETLTARR